MAHPALAGIKRREGDTRDSGRESKGKINQGINQFFAEEVIPHQHPGHQKTKEGIDGGSGQGGAKGQPVGSENPRLCNDIPEALKSEGCGFEEGR